MKAIFSLVLITAPLLVCAQRTSNPQKAYLSGKDFYNTGQYHMAMESFKSLSTYNNTFVEYATFYYGLSANYNGQEEIAKNILLQLSRKYPNWDKRHEVYFWLGKLYFEKGDYVSAVDHLSKIDNASMTSDITNLKLHHLKNAPLDELSNLYEKYPNDREVGESYAIAIGQQPMSKEEMAELQEIIEKHDLSEENISSQYVGATSRKEKYKIAVCFPFLINDVSNERRLNSNQWVLDMYQGIQLAHSELVSQNIPIELYAYDTERDSAKTGEILSLDELKNMDLIIGPLYPAPSELASSFAFSQKINILNPLSSNTDIISHNPYSFLFHPSDKTQAEAAARYIVNQLDKQKKTLIIYSSRAGDSIAAFQYRSVLLEQKMDVIMMDQIPTVDSEEIARFVSENLYEIFTPAPDDPDVLMAMKEKGNDDEDDEDEFIPRSNIDHVFVASSNELIVANVIGTIDNMGPNISIMGSDKWLSSRYIDFRQLERLNVYMAAPTYLDYSTENYKKFNNKYVHRYKSIPNNYSYIGYDLIVLFGGFLIQGGTYFQHEIRNQEFYPGNLFQGYRYADNNDNSYVPIIHFENGVLNKVNK